MPAGTLLLAQGPGAVASGLLTPITLSRLLSTPGLALAAVVAGLVLLPGMLLLMTSFTRMVVVLSLVRTALGIPQTPPNQIIVGLALILTAYTMAPTLSQINRVAVAPYLAGRLNVAQAAARAEEPLKVFLAQGTRQQDLTTLLAATGQPRPRTLAQLPLLTLIPAFAISQLTLAFQMAFLLFLPFLVIDFLVSSVLMSLGMMMLPPTVVSLPFKLLLFVLVNGWSLVVGTLVASPHG
jgi:flagellar biosynthetic protein FliP